MRRHFLGSQADRPQPWPYGQPAWVSSTRTLPPVPGADIRFVQGDMHTVHREMIVALLTGCSMRAPAELADVSEIAIAFRACRNRELLFD